MTVPYLYIAGILFSRLLQVVEHMPCVVESEYLVFIVILLQLLK